MKEIRPAEPGTKKDGKNSGFRKTFTKGRKAFKEFLGGEYLSRNTVTHNIGFIIYLGVLAMIYISNTYYTEKLYKKIGRASCRERV